MDENFTPPVPDLPPAPPAPAPASRPPPLPATPPPLAPHTRMSPPPRRRGGLVWMLISFVLAGLLVAVLVINALPQAHGTGPRLVESWIKEATNSSDRIMVVPIEGVIMGQGFGRGPSLVDIVETEFKLAARDKRVKAVVLKVNSPGGEVIASDDIHNIIERFQRQTGKPVVAAMGSLAASGGYYVSAPCQWIVANEMTMTGSIGVIMHGYNFRGLMDKVGVRPEVFKSGKLKDMLSPDKREEDITQEEREIIQSMVNETFGKFKGVVAAGRANAARRNRGGEPGTPLVENWAQYADGRVLSGNEALKLGFIDELGGFDAAVARAEKLAGIRDANVIQFQPQSDLADLLGLFGQSEARTLKIDLGLDAPRLQTGRLYFLCPLVLPR